MKIEGKFIFEQRNTFFSLKKQITDFCVLWLLRHKKRYKHANLVA